MGRKTTIFVAVAFCAHAALIVWTMTWDTTPKHTVVQHAKGAR